MVIKKSKNKKYTGLISDWFKPTEKIHFALMAMPVKDEKCTICAIKEVRVTSNKDYMFAKLDKTLIKKERVYGGPLIRGNNFVNHFDWCEDLNDLDKKVV